MTKAVDLLTKIAGFLAAVLGLVGYVLILGAAILWLRLHQVNLPPEVPVSLATREELIAIGAQAIAVWVLLAGALSLLAAWIITGDPKRRSFDYYEAGLALAVTVSILLSLRVGGWLFVLPLLAVTVTIAGALIFWPSLDAVATVVVPTAVGLALGFALHHLSRGNGLITAAGAALVFGALLLLTPPLQRWRYLQENSLDTLARIKDKGEKGKANPGQVKTLVGALESVQEKERLPAVVLIERIAIITVALVAMGAVAVASQVDRDEDFHRVLVSLANGDCVKGTYVVRGKDQVTIAQPEGTGTDDETRITTIPTKEILEVQVYGEPTMGAELFRDEHCDGTDDSLVRPAKAASGGGDTAGS